MGAVKQTPRPVRDRVKVLACVVRQLMESVSVLKVTKARREKLHAVKSLKNKLYFMFTMDTIDFEGKQCI